jgi:hypothetical protein
MGGSIAGFGGWQSLLVQHGMYSAAASDLLAVVSLRTHPPGPLAALKRQLVELQGEVAEAHQRLHLTQGRVEHNLQRISELKQEALALGDQVQRQAAQQQAVASSASSRLATTEASSGSSSRLATAEASSGSSGDGAASSVVPAPAGLQAAATAAVAARLVAPPQQDPHRQQQLQQQRRARGRGLHSSLEIEEELKNHWFAVSFVSKLGREVSRCCLLRGVYLGLR